jgi:IMP dehydrogenase
MVSRRDLLKNKEYPLASKEESKSLLVGAAVSTHGRDRERAIAVYEAGAHVLIVDAAQGDSPFQIETIQHIRKNCAGAQIIAGNVVTPLQAAHLIAEGVDGIRVGMGAGSICTTQETVATGRGQASAVFQVAEYARKFDIPVIADGGISDTAQLAKAFALGASAAMMGGFFAGTVEAPGEYFYDQGVRVKRYRGMASLEAMQIGGAKRYFAQDERIRVAQGVSGTVVDRGSLHNLIPYMRQALKHALQDMGTKSITVLHQQLASGQLRFEQRTEGARAEGRVHGLNSYVDPGTGRTMR